MVTVYYVITIVEHCLIFAPQLGRYQVRVASVEHCRNRETGKGGWVARARLDVAALYAALDKERGARGLSWRSLAKEVGVSPSTLSRMANGQRPDVDAFAALTSWLGTGAETYLVSEVANEVEPDLMTELAPMLRARKDLRSRDVEYLEELIGAAVRRFRADEDDDTRDTPAVQGSHEQARF
jgi:transcriptional regulator with XRE-family HTH domain